MYLLALLALLLETMEFDFELRELVLVVVVMTLELFDAEWFSLLELDIEIEEETGCTLEELFEMLPLEGPMEGVGTRLGTFASCIRVFVFTFSGKIFLAVSVDKSLLFSSKIQAAMSALDCALFCC